MTRWSDKCRAKVVGLSPATVHRIWQKHGLQPPRTETFEVSRDPEFESKMADVVGLCFDPPERALVLSINEKAQIPARMTHDDRRDGATSLFAALDVAGGKVHGRCYPRHRHAELLASIAKRYPRREIHLICDHYGTHEHPKVNEWLAKHPRFRMHFTPTSASWLALVERRFALITSQAIRRGSFDSVRHPERAMARHLAHWNENAEPFRWTKSPREIRRQIHRVGDPSEMRR